MLERLEKLDERNTLLQVVKALQKHFLLEKLESLNMLSRSFVMTKSFLIEVWDRILEDVQLHDEYWSVYAKLNDPALEEEQEPTAEEKRILKRYNEHYVRLNLDVEDWFLHAHILMEKYARLAKEIMVLVSQNSDDARCAKKLPTKSFHKYMDFFLRPDNQKKVDSEYSRIIKESAEWYLQDMKDVRDDLIQHEATARFWGTSLSPKKFRISRFRHSDRLVQALYELRDEYAETYKVLKGERDFFKLLSFFEANISKLKKPDEKRVRQIRKTYGRDFPDILNLHRKINNFLCSSNDHFMAKIRERFKEE